MSEFSEFFLMKPEDVKRYTVEVLHFFKPEDQLSCIEIGDGNINYVFKVWAESDGRSVIVKQADKLLRSSGRPLDIRRNKIEAEILGLEKELAPRFIPAVYHYDETMAALSMEDVSAYKNLRKELMEDRVYGHLAENLSDFVAETLLPTTDLVMDRQEKRKRVQFFSNPELCDISEDLVLTEPYYEPFYNERNKNVVTAGNEEFVKENLYDNIPLQAEVGKLRNHFLNDTQALIHGDLHSGSIFANESGIKVIDPEFACYAPMGYDIGNVTGNLFFSLANKYFTSPEKKEVIAALENTISDYVDLTEKKLSEKYDELVEFRFYRSDIFKKWYLGEIKADSIAYAATEIIRRTVGDSKVMELNVVKDPVQKIPMERSLIELGIWMIMNRYGIKDGKELTDKYKEIVGKYEKM